MAPRLPSSLPLELLDRFAQLPPPLGCALPTSRLAGDAAFCDAHYKEALVGLSSRPQEPLAVYVHVPFCHVRCLYCACNTTITHSEEKVDQYLDALDREMALVTDVLGRGRSVAQLHVGGGTPNHLNEPQLARLMEIVERHFSLSDQACTSIECNPRRTSAGQLDLLYGLGFRRISFGVQDLNADVQRAIGRVQSLDMVRDVFLTARETGFETINLDLVYGLPFQTAGSFQATLDQIVALGPDRIACFSYAHDPASRPHQHAISADHLPSATKKLALFHQAVQSFSAAGYRWVGLDVFARETDELTSAQDERRLYRNAIGYTPMPARQVLAFGPSGIGEVCGTLVQNQPDLKAWQRSVVDGILPVAWGLRLSERDRRRREAILYLMCNLELPATSAQGLESEYESLCRNAGYGLLEVTDDGVRVTPEGRYLLHGLCVEQDASVDWGSTQWRATAGS
ncbi:MAG: oxygen-independent coproporphyrinogen III oxidase [Thiocapsa sp.]|jgi:oxygen-independent coproporphyrinogen-3 oxidase|nr:oxygen-independent coproporphyrinogen III oxidase [Thiocapsa sp.]MCG6897624.1 oxygen-independent coproporphyrinogen III oxidase [Thiocapsa sp.]MCG6984660.1 oxygen-independent coproporphyrinogen III oxidase [Thiocapsa sp.]